jgi:hypothetical protein
MPVVSPLSPRSALVLFVSALAAGGLSLASPGPALAARAPMVSVQPLEGRNGARVRQEVARVVRGRRYRVVTEVPSATGTGQYYTWARELGLTAFVVGELVEVGRRQRVTFLVWSGHDGSVVGRWTVSATREKLPATVAKNFWRRLGPALRRARPPREWTEPPPGPTIRIDASSRQDDDIMGVDIRRRRL